MATEVYDSLNMRDNDINMSGGSVTSVGAISMSSGADIDMNNGDINSANNVVSDEVETGLVHANGADIYVGYNGDNVYTNNDLYVEDDIYADGAGQVVNMEDGIVDDDFTVYDKLTVGGATDPPCVLFDLQTREGIADLMERSIPPSKQGGATMFFNQATKRIEIYIQSEGKYYDLQGNVLHTMSPRVKSNVVKRYFLSPITGEVEYMEELEKQIYSKKKGVILDRSTGKFYDKEGKKLNKEDAIEIHARKIKVPKNIKEEVTK